MNPEKQETGDRGQETGDRNYRLRKGDDIAERLLDLGAQIVGLLRPIPRDAAGRHLAIQLFRCATSPGANSFIHKISIAAKEARETRFWLALLHRRQLAAILGASARTARSRAASGRR